MNSLKDKDLKRAIELIEKNLMDKKYEDFKSLSMRQKHFLFNMRKRYIESIRENKSFLCSWKQLDYLSILIKKQNGAKNAQT